MSTTIQIALETWLSIALFWVLLVVLLGQWCIMTFMWPRNPPEWAVWAKTTAFLSVVIARLILYYTGNPRYPFPIGAILNGLALMLILYFGKVYLWDTWVKGKYARHGGNCDVPKSDHGGFVGRYWNERKPGSGSDHDHDPGA